MEKRLRELGLDVTLKKGVIELLQQYTVCTEGQPLTSEAARVLVSTLSSPSLSHYVNRVIDFSFPLFPKNRS